MATRRFFDSGQLVGVLVRQPIDTLLDYYAPESGCELGALVEVPLGYRKVIGVVWGAGAGQFDPKKTRNVIRVLDATPLPESLRRFLEKAARYTLTPLPAMLRLATRAPDFRKKGPKLKTYRLGDKPPIRLTQARQKVLNALGKQQGRSLSLCEITSMIGVSTAVIKSLVLSDAIIEEHHHSPAPFPNLDVDLPAKSLTPEQQTVAQVLRTGVRSNKYRTTLLYGVTGSGKTEVYLEAVAEAIAMGQQALVLLPEISLTGGFLRRVHDRFGAQPAEWHSGITMSQRRRIWHLANDGRIQLVVGARSALFLPFRNLGLIIVDEEHDTSYKQDEGVIYNARDMSVLRGVCEDAQVVLSSATPSLESWVNATSGKYQELTLTKRFGAAVLPQIHTVDMRNEKLEKQRCISPSLSSEISRHIRRGEQVLLFLNRRGYAPVVVCRACGQQLGCDHCDARMVEHRSLTRLMCHQCGATKPFPQICPACGVEDRMAAFGPGVERLAEEVKEQFPDARVSTLSSDLLDSTEVLRDEFDRIAKGQVDIIIGTQLVAKGHNFPFLTLVGVIDADLGLQGSDLRAAERTFQLISQVAGRAGRSDKPGKALLQTYQPEHPVIRAIRSGEDSEFWKAEAVQRQAAGMPPFGRLAAIILSGPQQEAVFRVANEMARNHKPLERIAARVYGPALAPISRIRGRYRVRLLVRANREAALQSALLRWIAPISLRGDIRLRVDIDPQNFQ
ncbi:MAG: primosomal protein N' [Aestuariivita sp.]|nr:primosomal protein N' [Aestuariivita sp.]MCY4203511.1 primosomal protein N' [Aestuariivita sp.]